MEAPVLRFQDFTVFVATASSSNPWMVTHPSANRGPSWSCLMAAIPGCIIFDPRLAFGENEDDRDLANLISSGCVTVTRKTAAVISRVGEHLVNVYISGHFLVFCFLFEESQ